MRTQRLASEYVCKVDHVQVIDEVPNFLLQEKYEAIPFHRKYENLH